MSNMHWTANSGQTSLSDPGWSTHPLPPIRSTFTVTVEARTGVQAQQVMIERLNGDEDYGFDYSITWTPAK